MIWVEAQVERHSRSRVEILVKARSQFKERRYSILSYCICFSGQLLLLQVLNRLIFKILFTNGKMIELNSTATNVEIELPVSSDASNPDVRTSMGSASYVPEDEALIWKIRSFPGGKVSANPLLFHC